MKKLLLLVLILTLTSITFADDIIIESFEEGGPVLGWQEVSPVGQTQNTVNATPNLASTDHVTHGSRSGKFTSVWTKPGAAADSNAYVSGGPLTFWSKRINCGTPAVGPNIPNDSVIRADVYNNSADSIQFALYVGDNGGQTTYERGPLMALAPNSANVYEWKMGEDPTTAYITGNGVLDGSASKLRGMVIYTDTEPTDSQFVMDVDNIRIVEGQSDLTPPANPIIYSVTQGSAPNKLLVKWAANTDPDIAKYSIYYATNEAFGKTIYNRFSNFTKLPTDINHPTTQAEIDAPTTSPLYIYVTAWDNALPKNNESGASQILGAWLNPSGSAATDLIVLETKRYTSGADYINQGYWHMVAYGAQALKDNNRYYGSATAAAVAGALVTLNPNPSTIVMWSCARDGEAGAVRAVTPECLPLIESYIGSDGKFIISGTGLGKDMVSGGNAVSFFTDVLKANLVNGTASQAELMGDGALAGIATFFTGTNLWDYAAFAAGTNNEVLSAQVGAEAAISYAGGVGNAAVVYGQQVATLGFGFESVRHTGETSGTFAAARATRALLMKAIVDYFFAVPPTAARVWNIYE